ncbi:MAG TPA: hypothetical protein VFF28_00275 [Candidatus Nanoarchaeia archaeon]|nr:hypothetical protein [Candidatus Nanoarchaeia archaeon]
MRRYVIKQTSILEIMAPHFIAECPIVDYGFKDTPCRHPEYRVETPIGTLDISSLDLKCRGLEWDLVEAVRKGQVFIGIRYNHDGKTTYFFSDQQLARVREVNQESEEWLRKNHLPQNLPKDVEERLRESDF